MRFSLLLVVLVCGFTALPVFAGEAPYQESSTPNWQSPVSGVLVAKAIKNKASKSTATNTGRERFIVREARLKGKDQKDIDFGDVSIGGQRKTPMSQLITNGKANKDHDFIKIRLRWHPEMVQSASSLDAGATLQ